MDYYGKEKQKVKQLIEEVKRRRERRYRRGEGKDGKGVKRNKQSRHILTIPTNFARPLKNSYLPLLLTCNL